MTFGFTFCVELETVLFAFGTLMVMRPLVSPTLQFAPLLINMDIFGVHHCAGPVAQCQD